MIVKERLPQSTDVTQEIWKAAVRMFTERMPARSLRVRLLGVGVTGFQQRTSAQLNLFPDEEHERSSRLDEVTDQIKDKFGASSVQRALGMLHDVETKAGERGPNRDQYGE